MRYKDVQGEVSHATWHPPHNTIYTEKRKSLEQEKKCSNMKTIISLVIIIGHPFFDAVCLTTVTH